MRSAIEREKRQARGIVIRHGAFARGERSAFWAYLWSEELLSEDARGRSDDSRIASHESRRAGREK